MMQFNLLPDVKLQYIKAQRTKRLIMSISAIATAAAIALFIILLGMVLWQKKSLGDLNHDVQKYSGQINGTKDLNKVLTIQNQLNSLPGIDSKKPDVTKISTYLAQLTPSNVNYSDVNIDLTKDSMDITGSAKDLATVDQFVDTLKFATYSTNSGSSSKNVFSGVVLSSFNLSTQTQTPNTGASYTIDATFDPTIFNASLSPTVQVKSQITTRSELDQPTSLFTGNNGGTQ